MDDQQRNLEVVRSLGRLWNAGDFDGVLRHYSEDVEVITDPGWPDTSTSGKAAFARATDEWRAAWDTVGIEMGETRAAGPDTVFAEGVWESRGAASGIDGRIPFWILFTLREGSIVRMQWFMDGDAARAAAGL